MGPVEGPGGARAAGPATTSKTGNGADAGTAKEPERVALPKTLDTKDLDDDEKALLGAVLSDQFDPCGKSRSFLESLADPATCPIAKKLGNVAVEKIAQGLSKKQVVQELLKEQARWASRAEFDLEGVGFVGTPGPGKRVIVEFSDFECPHCRTAAKPVKELAKKYDAVLYSKMLPFDFHAAAKPAALSAYAASKQGKFWEVSDTFFANQQMLKPETVRSLVEKAGVDMVQFDKDLVDPAVARLLDRDLAEAKKYDINETPTFFVDGFRVDYEKLEETLQAPPQQ